MAKKSKDGETFQDPLTLWLPAVEAIERRAAVVRSIGLAINEIVTHVHAGRLPLGTLCAYDEGGLMGDGDIDEWVGESLPPKFVLRRQLQEDCDIAIERAVPYGQHDDGNNRVGYCRLFVGRRRYAELFGATTPLPTAFYKAPPIGRRRRAVPEPVDIACIVLRHLHPGLNAFQIRTKGKTYAELITPDHEKLWTDVCTTHGVYYPLPSPKTISRAIKKLAMIDST